MTNKNSTAFIFKTYRQPITVINLTGGNSNHEKNYLRATEIRKGQDFKITQPKRDRKHVEFSVKNDEDTYKFHIDIFDNGSASINVMPQQREMISFNGEIELHE